MFQKLFFIFAFVFFSGFQAQALYTEIGADYGYNKSSLDSSNTVEQQNITGSLTFYIWQQVALELAYTNGLYVQREKQVNGVSALRTTTLYTDVYASSLVYFFTDNRQAMLQPFVKGGMSYVKKREVIQDDGQNASEINIGPSFAPNYGVGIKMLLTASLSIKASYEVQQTPLDDGSNANDITGRVGLAWGF